MHCSVSGCGDVLATSEEEAISYARTYLSYFPENFRNKPQAVEAKDVKPLEKTIADLIPENQNAPFNKYDFIERLIDEDSICEVKKKFAPELITGLTRLDGKSIVIIANKPRVKGGVMFNDSADISAKFIMLCD